MSYPYYTEPEHDQGIITNATDNAARSTATSLAEGRLKVDVVDKIHLLERMLNLALLHSNVQMAK